MIGSDTLPIAGEYLPIAIQDGFLTHYKTDAYAKALTDLGIEKTDVREIFKKNTQKILDIYYPLSTTAGGTRSSIIFSRDNIYDGQNIEMVPEAAMQT